MRSARHGPSFLRWAGSKRQSLPALIAALPEKYDRYVEPFAGSAALFFAVTPPCALLGDLNSLLLNALHWVRYDCESVLGEVRAIPRSPDQYYAARTELNAADPQSQRAAALFIYVNRNCFNGLWRTNRLGHFNVPFGGHEIGNYPPDTLFQECAAALGAAELAHQDFRKTLAVTGRGDVIFADPPYVTTSERTFVEYGKESFGAEDLADLVSCLHDAESKGAKIILTYSGSMDIPGLSKRWSRKDFGVTRNVGGFKDVRRKYAETLYTSFS
jgi:DNA adenine methylase